MLESAQARPLAVPLSAAASDNEVPARVDPYWNHLPRVALMYSLPVFLLGWCVSNGWIGPWARDFWVPLALAFVLLASATRLWSGRPFSHKDFQNRDRFIATAGLMPAVLWCALLQLLPGPAPAALAFVLTMLAWDAALLRWHLLCVFAFGPAVALGGVWPALTRLSLPLWSYFAAALWAVHAWGEDQPLALLVAVLLAGLVPAAAWWAWRRWAAPARRLTGIRKVAVVGGGWAGIYATRWLREAGLQVTCLERSDCVGGIWRYRPEQEGGAHESTRVTASKHFLHGSDYPIPAWMPEFPHRTQVLEFLQGYVDHFGIGDSFRLNTAVESVDKDGASWRVVSRSAAGERVVEAYDAVVVCSGPHQNPNIRPTQHALYAHFAGRILHSHEYKNAAGIAAGSIVLIVGAGESSADIVTDCVGAGATVHWSVRSGQWFADRNMGPYPADHITTQGMRVLIGRFGYWEYLVRRFVAGAFVNLAWGRGGHGVPEWLPDSPYLHQFLNKSRDGVLEVYRGAVTPHRGIASISGREVRFVGDDRPLLVDTIILATGFKSHWPFLREQPRALYKLVFNPADPTLAFVGYARPIIGSIPSLSELQSRWLAGVWAGRLTLPAAAPAAAERELEALHHKRLIRDASDLGILVEQELYATDVAMRMNAHVHWFKLLFTWPRALVVLLISPWAPFKYHFNDPDPARRAQALAHTERELPGPRAPAYLLAAGIVFTAAFMIAVAAQAFRLWPVGEALMVLAGGGLLLSMFLRGSEVRVASGGGRPGAPRWLQRVREVFPF